MYVATDGVHPHSVPLYVDIMSIITIETIELKSKLNAQIEYSTFSFFEKFLWKGFATMPIDKDKYGNTRCCILYFISNQSLFFTRDSHMCIKNMLQLVGISFDIRERKHELP